MWNIGLLTAVVPNTSQPLLVYGFLSRGACTLTDVWKEVKGHVITSRWTQLVILETSLRRQSLALVLTVKQKLIF